MSHKQCRNGKFYVLTAIGSRGGRRTPKNRKR